MARIFIIEDEAQVLTLAESVLQEAGHDTISASTVAEAQAIVHSVEEFDLVFTDIGLADQLEGGITVGQAVEQARSGTPVVYTSGRALTDGMQSLFSERSAFLPKPYTAQQLIEVVDDILERSA
ncbi:MAG TPA: response regulator [Xanthobacteraceae bacterium]|nr:response regulator [Xanthobacteraceae bacterium]